MFNVLFVTHKHTLSWLKPNSHEFRALFQFSDLGLPCANKACCLVWFFLHLCVSWCNVTMSPLKRATVKRGNSKGKDHVINVDDLSPRLKRNRSLSRVYDPNKFRTYAAFETHEKYFREAKPLLERVLHQSSLSDTDIPNDLPQKIETTFSPHLMMHMRIWWKNFMLMQ